MKKKLKLNTIFSLLYEITAIVSGFVIPKLIIWQYGSSVNGLVNSVTQFISVISFMELGIGKVVQSSLYKPLASNDVDQISRVVVSAQNFFHRLSMIMVVYISLLIVSFPYISGKEFSWAYSAILIIAMSISSFAQYYFGIVNRLLLTADQKGYIQYAAQTGVLIANIVFSVVLIRLNVSIQLVKLTTSLIFVLRPLYLSWYVKHHYNLNYSIKYDKEPIEQKWNGIAQHVAYVVLNDTDTIVLTIFGSFSDVSVYSVYHLVVYGVKRLFTSMTNGIEAILGELWAKRDDKALDSVFNWTEWIIHTSVIVVFGCTGALILPFISVYTKGVTDANYIQPVFALLIVAAHACHCLRLPYNLMIFAAGHYRQTQNNYIFAAVLNIVISVVTVTIWGLVGVAIGTLVSMLYQTVWMAYYNSLNLIKRPMWLFLKQLFVDLIIVFLMIILNRFLMGHSSNYFEWVLEATKCFLIYLAISVSVNCVFYRKNMISLFMVLLKRMI